MITVVITSFHYGHLVAHALESVLAQTQPPDDIILVDDGAHDGVEEIANKYGVRCVSRETNLGIVPNFNDILYNHVRTDKVLFLGADNWLRPDTLQHIGGVTADIISYDIAITGEGAKDFARTRAGEQKSGSFIWRFHPGNIGHSNFIHGSSLYNVDLARKVGGYKASGGANSEEDWMLWKRMLEAGATHHHVQEPLLFYRRHRFNFQKY